MTQSSSADGDRTVELAERVSAASASGEPLVIKGCGTRCALGHDATGADISTLRHTGIVNHEPTELVLTARAGTPIRDLTDALSQAGQMLPFEPPDQGGTLGGVVACGLSGPRRPYAGAVRDFVLGTRVINGRGEVLSFGGEVMKNVAGYDVSRVQCGAFGTLGLLLDISMKVLPLPELELTLRQELTADKADTSSELVALARRPLPLSAGLVHGREQYIRLSGSAAAVETAAAELGGDRVADAASLWRQVREHTHAFFDGEQPLWRLAVPEHTPPIGLAGEWLLDWGGAQRWLRSDAPAEVIFAAADVAGGHARRYRKRLPGGDWPSVDGPLFQPLEGPMQRLQSRLRDSFDPQRIFNRGRFHPELDRPDTTDQ